MSINSVSSIQNFSILKNNKTENTVTNPSLELPKNDNILQNEQQQKQMVNSKTILASYSLPKMSFKGNVQNNEMSDEEFEKLKNRVEDKIIQNSLSSNVKSEEDLEKLLDAIAQGNLQNLKNYHVYGVSIEQDKLSKQTIKPVLKAFDIIEKDFEFNDTIHETQTLVIDNQQIRGKKNSSNQTLFMEFLNNHIISAKTEKQIEFVNQILSDENIDRLEKQKSNVMEHRDKYINGEMKDEEQKNEVNKFFRINHAIMLVLSVIFDDKTVNTLLRSRFDNAQKYLNEVRNFNETDIELLEKLANSKNQDNGELTEKEKIGFIDLITAYKIFNLDTLKMQKMAASGIVDTKELNRDLFAQILNNCGLTTEEISKIPHDKLTSWNLQYMHLLAGNIKDDEKAFGNLLKAANLENFNEYIKNKDNEYGTVNAETQEMFTQNNMDYNKWLNPSEENNIRFTSKDKNEEQLVQIGLQIEEDIQTLMKTPASGFIKKQFPNCIKDGKFMLPNNCQNSKAKLSELITNMLKQLSPVFKRAEGNLNNPAKKEMAANTLTIKEHLVQRLDDISKVSDVKTTKNLDLTIKMWDRNPQKDLFQGNYSTCCIGIGNGNGSAMPHYLMNTAYNMIELTDNKTGEIKGNALCYFVKDENNKPAFIVDNIEINNSYKPSDEVGKELRNAITQYAVNIATAVTGRSDTPIYMSSNFNDVPVDDLGNSTQKLSFIGNIDSEEIYMDLYEGWVKKDNETNRIPDRCINVLKLK